MWDMDDLDVVESLDETDVVVDISDANAWTEPAETTTDVSVETLAPAPPSMPNDRHMYLPFIPSTYLQHHSVVPLPSETPLSCLEAIFVADEAQCKDRDAERSIDVVWSWANSSDYVWRYAHDTIEHKAKGKKGDANVKTNPLAHFRDFDELRYSMRGVLRHFEPHVKRFHLVASDFVVPEDIREEYNLTADLRLGQLPQWLNPSQRSWRDKEVQLNVHHHSSFFRQYTDTVFSSFTIESQMQHMLGVSDVFVYLNDDMYFLKDLHPADFYTSAYGFVFRVDMTINVPPALEPNPKRGEWQPLRESNIVLSKRFGHGTRPYVVHMAKTMSLPILREIGASFPEAYDRTGARLFREVWRTEPGDVHTAFMMPQFVVERWREALLWSWTVARLGEDDDSWDARAAWTALRGGEKPTVSVGKIQRDTLDTDRILAALGRSGYGPPGGTDYIFASGDGYPFYALRGGTSGYPNQESERVCTINRNECFPSGLTTASAAFQHIAFAKPQCGDCTINRLVQQSGRLGLSEFLPRTGRTFVPGARGPLPETLPIVSEWAHGEFALADVLRQAPDDAIDVRGWAMRLLDRYRFVLGQSPTEFVFVSGPASLRASIAKIESEPDTALTCFNDDVSGDGIKVAAVMREFQQRRWSDRAQWEHP